MTRGKGVPGSFWVIAALLLMPSASAGADPDPSITDKIEHERRTLEKLKGEIKETKKQAGEAEQQRRSLLQSIQELDDSVMLRREQRSAVNRELKRKDRELETITNQLDGLRTRIRDRRSSILTRLRVQYMHGRLGYLKALLAAESPADLHRRFQYLAAISEREYALLESYRTDVARLEDVERTRAQARDQMLVLKQRTDRKLTEIRHLKRQKRRLLARITREKESYDRAVQEKELSAAQVDALLKELEQRRKAAKLVPSPGGVGPRGLKGALPWPAMGRVVSFFGRQKHPTFETYIERKGIVIQTGEGTEIRAVMDGTVVYADWLKGYGLVLILDHRNGFFSLYAHASKLLTKVGTQVQAGGVIGETGDTGLTDDNILYFELRDGAAPVDPLLWLAKRP